MNHSQNANKCIGWLYTITVSALFMLWCIHLDGFGSSYRMFRKKNQNFHLVFFIICLFFFSSKGKYDIDIYFLCLWFGADWYAHYPNFSPYKHKVQAEYLTPLPMNVRLQVELRIFYDVFSWYFFLKVEGWYARDIYFLFLWFGVDFKVLALLAIVVWFFLFSKFSLHCLYLAGPSFERFKAFYPRCL